MAYNRTANPDSLPAFAEPERKNKPAPAQPPQPAQPPYQAHQTPAPQQYQNRPAPLPRPDQRQPQYQSGGQRLSPQAQPPSNYGYGSPTPPGPGYGAQQPPGPGYGSPPPPNPGYGSQPPANAGYGYTSPPPGSNFGSRPSSTQSRPPPASRPPPSPAPPNGADPALWPLFKAVDKSGTGQLTENELRSALVNGDWTSFDPYTVKMMIRMFDTDRSGSIGFDEFCGLWGFLAAWRSLFDRFDTDRSGNISVDEFTNALVAFGYRLSPQFVDTLFQTYDKRNEGAIGFDLFVQSCISLKRMTDVFKKYDDDRDGFITLSFEDFLTEIIRQK